MSGDYSLLRNYVSENNRGLSSSASTSVMDGLSGMKNSISGIFGKSTPSSPTSNSLFNSTSSNGSADQTESWFKDAESDPFCPKLSKTQRIIGFMTCLLMGAFCMFLASLYIPVIVLKARKFVLLFSLGSLFFIFSFSILWGVMNHLKHLTNPSRLPFTASYFFTLFGTIYCAMIVKSVVLTLIFASLQIGSLVWFIISYLPGGQTGLKFFTKLFYSVASKTVQTTLNV